MIKVLSIRQPWASLIIQGVKDIENRSWPTNFRGEFYVHAGKYHPKGEELRAIADEFGVTLDTTAFQYGGIIGAVRLVDCVTSHASRWFEGDYGFVLADARPVPFVPLRGALGFFTANDLQ